MAVSDPAGGHIAIGEPDPGLFGASVAGRPVRKQELLTRRNREDTEVTEEEIGALPAVSDQTPPRGARIVFS